MTRCLAPHIKVISPPPRPAPMHLTLFIYKTVLILPGGFGKLHRRGAHWPGTRSERMTGCCLCQGGKGAVTGAPRTWSQDVPLPLRLVTRPSNLLDPLWGMFPLSLSIFLMNSTALSSLLLPHHCLKAEAEKPEPIFCMALARYDTSLRFGILSFKMEKACSSYKIIVTIIR